MAAQRGGDYSTYRIYFNPYTFEFTDPSKSVFKPEEQECQGTDENKITEEADPKKFPAQKWHTGSFQEFMLVELWKR